MLQKLLEGITEAFYKLEAKPESKGEPTLKEEEEFKLPLDKLKLIRKKAEEKKIQSEQVSPNKALSISKSHKKLQPQHNHKLYEKVESFNVRKQSIIVGKKQDALEKTRSPTQFQIPKNSRGLANQKSPPSQFEKCKSTRQSTIKLNLSPEPCLSNYQVSDFSQAVLNQGSKAVLPSDEDDIPIERDQNPNLYFSLKSTVDARLIQLNQNDYFKNVSKTSKNQHHQPLTKQNSSSATFFYQEDRSKQQPLLKQKSLFNRQATNTSNKLTATTNTPNKKQDFKGAQTQSKPEVKVITNELQKKPSQTYIKSNFSLKKKKSSVLPLQNPSDCSYIQLGKGQEKEQNQFSQTFDHLEEKSFFPSEKSNFSYQPKFFKPSSGINGSRGSLNMNSSNAPADALGSFTPTNKVVSSFQLQRDISPDIIKQKSPHASSIQLGYQMLQNEIKIKNIKI